MGIRLLGQYDFDNYTLLNALMDEDERINTAVHEYTHFQLSNQSVYGLIQYCLNKLKISITCNDDANKLKTAMSFFSKNSIKVQEGLAVFIEATLFMLGNVEDYKKFIGDLKENNECYYRYVKPLCFILDYMEDVDYNEKLSIAHAVYQIALKSMNPCIYNYDGDKFSKNKYIKKLVSDESFSKEYLPNIAFYSMIEECKKQDTFEKFNQKLFKFAQSNISGDEDFFQDRLSKIKKFVLEIFKGSRNIDVYKNWLNQVEMQEVGASSIFLQQIPTAFNDDYIINNMKKIDFESLREKCRVLGYSTLFMLGGALLNNIIELFNKMGIVNWDLQEDISKEIIILYSLMDKEIFCCLIDKSELQEILNQNDNKCVLLTSYKNYDYDNNLVSGYSITTENIYIFIVIEHIRMQYNTLNYGMIERFSIDIWFIKA